MSKYVRVAPKALRLLHEESLVTFGGSRGVRDEGLFESAMMRPRNVAAYQERVDIADLAASYAHGLAKNHPFVDGNKRVAFLAVGIFLKVNGFRLTATPADAIQAVLGLASGEISEEAFAAWVRGNIKAQ